MVGTMILLLLYLWPSVTEENNINPNFSLFSALTFVLLTLKALKLSVNNNYTYLLLYDCTRDWFIIFYNTMYIKQQ